ncbi:MAG TPA: hypothetical protein VGL76_00755 [Gaiellaceae bacterium]|jgi:hypothetical protein
MRAFRFISAVLCAAAVVCAPAGAGVSGGAGAITAGGKVGPLQIDKSNRAAVVAFAGKPDAEVQSITYGLSKYDALGYGCSSTSANDNFTLANDGPYCQTAFFIDTAHKSLEDFITTSSSYHMTNGIHIGTTVSAAQRALHTRADRSCLVVLKVDGQKALLRINFTGGKADTFVLHSTQRTAGLFNCTA